MQTDRAVASDHKLDMERICRVCLRDSEELFFLFDESYSVEGVSMSQIITDCTIYRVERYDDLPHQICAACMRLARTAYYFKQRTEKSYRHLIDLIGDVSVNSAFRSEKWTQTDKLSIYPCELCDSKFFDSNDLKGHRYSAHKGESYHCKVCAKPFGLLRHLQSHLALAHPNESMHKTQCTICERHFSRKEHMRRHMLKVHHVKQNSHKRETNLLEEPKIDLKMQLCSFEQANDFFHDASVEGTTNWNEYTNEDLGKSDINPISPDGTDESEHDAELLTLQPSSLLDEPIVKVEPVDEILSVTFVSTELNIKCEVQDEEQVNEYTTNINSVHEQTMEKKPALKTEYLNKRANKCRDNKCPECNRKFTRRCHMLRHMLTHAQEKPYECEHCQKRFTRKDHLKNHINSLHREKQFKCDKCECAFPRNDSLAFHIKLKHTAEGLNLYKCHTCEKSFSTKHYMHRHRLLHTDRIFACKGCDETFKNRAQFRKHVKTHADQRQKPFICQQCGNHFENNQLLEKHKKCHTNFSVLSVP